MRHEPRTTSAPGTATPGTAQPADGRVAPARRVLLVVFALTALATFGWTASVSAAGATVDAATSSNFGTVLTDAQGFVLYSLPTDHGGMSTCTGACVSVWPALTVPAGTTPTAGSGVSGTVAAVLQSNGTYQVTYNGSPLYTFVGDTSPGQVSGNNVGGFTVVQLAATAPPPTSAPTSTPPPATTASTSPASTVPAPSAPTSTASSAPTSASSPSPEPASGAASTPSGTAAASSPTAASAPSSLADTGPGAGLMWVVIVGAALLGVSGAMLLVLTYSGRRARRALR